MLAIYSTTSMVVLIGLTLASCTHIMNNEKIWCGNVLTCG